MRLQDWQKRKQEGNDDLTLDEICDLEKAVERGDLEAQQILDDCVREDGYENWNEYIEKEFKPLMKQLASTWDSVIAKQFGADEVYYRALMIRLKQPEVKGDPVLSYFVGLGKNRTLREVVESIKALNEDRLNKPLKIPTANQAMAMQTPAPTFAPKTAKWSVRIVSIALSILGVAIVLVSNVASNTLPEEWKPYLWLSWPLLAVLLLLAAILSRWQAKQTKTNNA